MECRMLGRLELVASDGSVLPVTGVRASAVLAMLALESGQIVSTGRLIDAVWADRPPTTARAGIQATVSQLRGMLVRAGGTADLLEGQPNGYLLRLPEECVDARVFQARVRTARDVATRGRIGEAIRGFRAALDLWRGPALDGIASEPIEAAAVRWNEERAEAQEECIDHELALGRHRDVLSELATLVAEHPLRERPLGQLMVALYRDGEKVRALQTYQDAKARLIELFDAPPSDRLRELESRIRRDDPSLLVSRGYAEPIPTAKLPTGAADFGGREWAFDAVARWLAGAGPLLLVTAEPGGGKTAFARQLVRISDGAAAPSGDLGAGIVAAAHFCQHRVVESVDALRVVQSLARQLCHSVPGYRQRLVESGDGQAASLDEILRSERTPRLAFDRFVRRPLRGLRRNNPDHRPVLVIIDALDEAAEGGAGYGLVSLLVHESRIQTPMLRLLITSRPGRAVRGLEASRHLDLVEDEDNRGEDVRRYVARRLSQCSDPGAAALAKGIGAQGGGNFLYATVILDDVLDRDPVPLELAAVSLPDGLTGLYRAFLSREIAAVDPDWRRHYRPLLGLLTQARSSGFTAEQLRALTGLPRSAVDDALAACAPYLRSDSPSGPYRIFHQSLRDYLSAPGEHHVYPAEANARILDYLEAELAREEMHPYVAPHLLRHVIEAAEADRDGRCARLLGLAVRDVRFMIAKTTADGPESLAGELDEALAATGGQPDHAARLAEVLKRQAYNLRTWRPAEHPGFLTQQLRFEAEQTGAAEVVEEVDRYLSPSWLPYSRIDWCLTGDTRVDGHTDTVSVVSMAPGRVLLTGSYDHTVRVWDETGTPRHILQHPGPVDWVEVLADRNQAAAICPDNAVYIWDLDTGREVRRLRHDGRVWAIAALPPRVGQIGGVGQVGSLLLAGSDDGTACLWDSESGQLVRRFEHDGPITQCAMSTDGKYVACVVGGRRIDVWKSDAAAPDRTYRTERPIVRIAFAGADRLVVAEGRYVRAWQLGSDESDVLAEHPDRVSGFSFVAGGKELVTVGRDNTGLIWSAGVPRPDFRIDHADWITSVTSVSGTPYVVTGSDDRSARWWDTRTGECVRELAGNTDSVRALTFSPDGSRVISGSDDATVRVRDTRSGRQLHVLRPDGWVRAVAASRDGALIMSGSDAGDVRIWDADSGACRHVLPHEGQVRAVSFVGDGERVITGCSDGRVRLWDCSTGDLIHTMAAHDGDLRMIIVAADVAASSSSDGTVCLWDLTSGGLLNLLRHDQSVKDLAFVPGTQQLVTGCHDGVARSWNLDTGRVDRSLPHDGIIGSVRVSRDGALAVTGSRDTTVKVWRLPDGQLLHTLRHDAQVRSAAFDPYAYRLISASDDRTARWWDLQSGREIARVGFHHRVAAVVPSPVEPGLAAVGTSRGEVCCIRTLATPSQGMSVPRTSPSGSDLSAHLRDP